MLAGLVLAAGAGTRFGDSESKLLASLDGRPLVEHAVAAMTAVDELGRVVVVLGARAGEVEAGVGFGRAEVVVCADWALGLSASLRCGVHALSGAERIVVALGDVPDLTASIIARFLDAPPGARAAYGGRPGHPVVLGRPQLAALAELRGDVGAGRLLRGGPLIECSDLAAGRDVDTQADLEAIRDGARAGI